MKDMQLRREHARSPKANTPVEGAVSAEWTMADRKAKMQALSAANGHFVAEGAVVAAAAASIGRQGADLCDRGANRDRSEHAAAEWVRAAELCRLAAEQCDRTASFHRTAAEIS